MLPQNFLDKIMKKGIINIQAIKEKYGYRRIQGGIGKMKNIANMPMLLFNRKLFMRMFKSYILIITLCIIGYSGFLFYQNHVVAKEREEQRAWMIVEEVDRILYERILVGQSIAAELTYSPILRTLYLSKISETPMDTVTYRDINEELKRAKMVNGLNVEKAFIFLNQDRYAYTDSGIVSLDDSIFEMLEMKYPYYGVGTVTNELSLKANNRYYLNKKGFLYIDRYTYQNGTSIGLVCVMFDLDRLLHEIEAVLGENCGADLRQNGQDLLTLGNQSGNRYSKQSEYLPGIEVILYAPNGALAEGGRFPIIMVLLLLCISAGFIALAYSFSKRDYRVIGDIERLVHSENLLDVVETKKYTAEGERESIVSGIQKMIGEKNGYQKKIITITPYVRAGMLQGLMTGRVEGNVVQILKEEYPELQKPFFIVAVANLAYDVEAVKENESESLTHILEQADLIFSTDEVSLHHYHRDMKSILFLVSTDNEKLEDDFFYNLYHYLESEMKECGCVVTMGVDSLKDNFADLKEAYEGAVQALERMIIDGRGTVYFREDLDEDEGEYYFPRYFREKLEKALKKESEDEIRALLKDVYDNNRMRSGNSKMYYALVDELHVTVLKVLKNVTKLWKVPMNIEKFTELATLEEIFCYYEQALLSVLSFRKKEQEEKKDIKLKDRDILAYIDENYCSPDMSLKLLEEKFHVSGRYLGMLYQRYYGMTYLQYLQKKRIEKAIELMQNTGLSLIQISEQCGYTNLLTFRRNFKAITGMNPSIYMD